MAKNLYFDMAVACYLFSILIVLKSSNHINTHLCDAGMGGLV